MKEIRHHGRDRRRDRRHVQEGRLKPSISSSNCKESKHHVCQRCTFLLRRPRPHAARRRHPRQRGQGDAWAPRAATSSSTSPTARRASPRTASPSPRKSSLTDKFENMGAQMVREVASKTNDSPATAPPPRPCSPQAIMREGLKLVAAGMNPMDLKRGIDMAVDRGRQGHRKARQEGASPPKKSPRSAPSPPTATRRSAR